MALFSLFIGAVCLLYILCTNPVRGIGRFLAPDTMVMLTMVSIFSIRPLFENRFEIRTIYGIMPDEASVDAAVLVGIVFMVSFTAAVFLNRVRPRRRSELVGEAKVIERRELRITASKTALVALVAFVAYIAVLTVLSGPSVFARLAAGRSSEAGLGGVPELVMILPMAGSITAALFIISRRGLVITRREWLVLAVAPLVSVMALSQLGNRRFLIPAILIPVVAALIRKPVRVKLSHVVVAFIAFLMLAIIPMVRSAGARMKGEGLLEASWRYFQTEGLQGVLTPVFASFDTEMLDYIAIISRPLGDGIPYGFGRGTVLEFFLRPLPSGISETTPYSDAVLTSVWGGGCGTPVCPVASTAGVLYFEGGLAFVAIGAFLYGILAARLSNAWKFNQHLSTLKLTTVALASAFALVATRTNTVHAIWWALYAVLLCFAVHWFLSRPIKPTRSNFASTQPTVVRTVN
ncbi:O-antigen polymerase [Paenarthrobacter sp. TA1.8]|uniref:O-antigen polymerase n=1 Tax=Paenarthrobacter sp. TA1.8 TaxID=3400219 RepID=UPI003B42E238